MRDWIAILKKEFDHPAIVLWRAIELRYIEDFFNRHKLSSPVLDLGCAEGKIADVLFKNNKLIGLDNCWELLSQNKKEDIYKALILADGCRMPFKNSVFGGVFSNCVIEHIPDMDSILSEVSRVLREKEIFLFSAPSNKFSDFLFFTQVFNKLRLKRLAQWYGRKRNKQLNHFHCYDHDAWRRLLKEKGLKMLEYRYYMAEKQVSAFDFLSALVVVLRSVWPLCYLIPKLNNWLAGYMRKSYDIDSQTGGALLIAAQKDTRPYRIGRCSACGEGV